jgi:hypothetical protein
VTTLLQAADGDIDITNGRASLVTGLVEKSQKINNRLGLFRGEWFLDTRVGTLWWERILGIKQPDLRLVQRVLRSAILSVPGIVDVVEEEISFASRRLEYSYVAVDDEGTLIEGGVGPSYIQAED